MKGFLLKQMLKPQLKKSGLSEADQEKMLNMIAENPEFFEKIAKEVQARVANGEDQMAAMMAVMKEREEELKKLL